jgi:hypothetical protein
VQIDWDSAAAWAQAITSTIVLFMIYFQIRQVNTQIIQNDEQERFRRSWEFVKLYRDELREDEVLLNPWREGFCPLDCERAADAFKEHMRHFYWPRYHLFVLLNKLVEHQEVDERILFGYLEEDFNKFIELGVRNYGIETFKTECGIRLKLLLTLWGSQIKSNRLLYGTTAEYAKQQSP